MRKHTFKNDESHPIQPTTADIILSQQLEYSISKYFYGGCDRHLQNLLSNCTWYVNTHAPTLTLVIECHDQVTNWRVLQKMVPMAILLYEIVSSAKIRICAPKNQGLPFEMRVDELSVYQDRA